jgi:hypothetical protein
MLSDLLSGRIDLREVFQWGNRRCHVAPYAMLRPRRKMCSFKGVRHGRMQDRGNDIDDHFVWKLC